MYNNLGTAMALIDDSNPELGGNLNTNGYAITDYVNGAIRFSSNTFEDINILTSSTGGVSFATTGSGAVFDTVNGQINLADIGVIRHCVSRGSLVSPENTHPGDILAASLVTGYHNGLQKPVSAVISGWAANADLSTDYPASRVALITGRNGSHMLANVALFDEIGVFTVPVFSATNYATTSLPVNPQSGWMVFDKTDSKFKGWNGTTWVELG